MTDSDLRDPKEPMPLESLATEGLGLDCERPAMSMMCPNELNELKFSDSKPPRGSATLRAISETHKHKNIVFTRAK